jgi:hypothetical protein
MSLFGLALYGLSNVIDFWRGQENRIVYMPASFMVKLRKTTLGKLVDVGIDENLPP